MGWGFVSEHAAFADLCRQLNIVFIGPEGNVMRWLGDKIASKHVAERVGVPVVPWSDNPIDTVVDARAHVARIGYPLLIKATAGGGGRGIRRVDREADLEAAFQSAREEARKAFGDATVFLEKVIEGARHVEVQIIGDHYGTVWAVGVRDCTVQRRNQKVIEEAPSPVLSPALDAALREAAVRLSTSAGYQNAGTVEFLFDPRNQRFYFMEVNARLQVEHPVTEITTGLDLVKLQIHVAQGGRLEGSPPPTVGWAIEARINAEDPAAGFAPAPGTVEVLRLPGGPGIRVDTGVSEGDDVLPHFDSMIAKIIACGRDRSEALARLRRALAESVIVLRGGTTNKAFLLDLLGRPEVQAASAHTGWLDRAATDGTFATARHADIALLQAAVEVYDAELALEQTQFYAMAARGRPQARAQIGHVASLRYRGRPYSLAVYGLGPNEYRIVVDHQQIDLQVERLGRFDGLLTCAGRRFTTLTVAQGPRHLIEVDGVSYSIARDDGGLVRASAPAMVLSIPVQVGDLVDAGARLVVLEAMKMEVPVLAPFAGRVREILVSTNVQVGAGTPLVLLDEQEAVAQETATQQVSFAALASPAGDAESPESRSAGVMRHIRRLVLGFDIGPAESGRLAVARVAACAALPPADQTLRESEDEVLAAFADLCALVRRHPASDDSGSAESSRTEEYLFTYLRSVDQQGENLPVAFRDKLRAALRHYGVDALAPTPTLKATMLRIFKSRDRLERLAPVIVGILERRLEHADLLRGDAGPEARALLDRLVAVTEGKYLVLSELAREVRYRWFDQQRFDEACARVYRDMDVHLDYLVHHPRAVDRADRMSTLVNCPQPLVSILARRFPTADAPMRECMLEVLTRRYYRIRDIQLLATGVLDGGAVAIAEYDFEGKRIHVLATHATYDGLGAAVAAVAPRLRAVPPEHDVVVDLYVCCSAPLPESDACAGELQAVLNRIGFPRRVRRVVVVLAAAQGSRGIAGVAHFTYRPGDGGYSEERVYRGIHPMMAKRMHLWRLSNFQLERLPSVEDVYLFRGVALINPKDERLFAIAEVRDLTPVRDATGRIVQLPYLERMLMEALAGIRQVQVARPPDEQLPWNRVLLYVWPPIDLAPDELDGIVRKLAPATAGLGIEQVVVRARMPHPETRELRDVVLRFSNPSGSGLFVTSEPPPTTPLEPLSEYQRKVARMRQRGLAYPYEVVRMLTPPRGTLQAEFPPGEFAEYDLDQENRLVAVDRPPGQNRANIVVGVIRNFTATHREGMTRVIVLGDPSRAMGAVAEPECRRIIAALDLADDLRVPLEWFPISAGAKIAMDSGTENMDWIASVLRRLIEFTQAGGEVNVIVNGINVGAQPYWNAEATMLLHTRGILVMTPQGAMVLTGKQALDYSGGVSAEDNLGIGGYERIMGPNGQAQYWARDLTEAAQILFRHYDHTYVAPGERFPRRAATTDPFDRNVCSFPHRGGGDGGFATVGEIFSDTANPGRKRPFDIRNVMAAVSDQDHVPLERWSAMREAEIAVVWDAHLGGYPVCLIGIESRPLPRLGFVPADGPDQWTAGTLFPRSSKKLARTITCASGNRPVVVLANLSGFDGSPESMRELQLEYGAEIGRSVVNFRGPIVFCVVSRYHGGAYVVFSKRLNPHVEAAALEGSFASVIGGAPAAAVVFATEVDARTRNDERVRALDERISAAGDAAHKALLRAEREDVYAAVRSEKLGEVAEEFDKVHSVQRAQEVGSLDHIISPYRLRPYLIDAVERGMRRAAGAT